MRMIYCTFRLAGFHCWPDAPDAVAYLRTVHRHEFHFKVSIDVDHNDRAIEFILKKQQCIALMYGLWPSDAADNFIFAQMSCEMIAEKLLQALLKEHPGTYITVDVSEDGENGAIVGSK